MNTLLSRLNKRDIVSLPGFERHESLKLNQLRAILQQSMVDLGINFRGARVSDYVNAFNQRAAEDESNEFVDSLMNMDAGYVSSKTNERLRYEENVHDSDKYQSEISRMMIAARKHESFEVTINDDSEIQYAFAQVLRYISKMNCQ